MNDKSNLILLYKERINKALDFIDQHLDEEIHLEDVAKAAFFSPFHFHRIFTTIIDETPNDYIRRLRLEKSAWLLKTNKVLSITETALSCGFSSSALFSKNFKKHFGITPMEWKNSKNKQIKSKNKNAINIDESYNTNKICRGDLEIEVVKMDAYKIASVRYLKENTKETRDAFKKIFFWAKPRGLITQAKKIISTALDNPHKTPEDKCRFYTCISIDKPIDAKDEASIIKYIQQYLEEVNVSFIQREGATKGFVNKKEKKMSTNFINTMWYSYTSSTATMRTWVNQVNSYEEVPQEFQTAFPKYKDSFPYTLFIPEDKYSLLFHRNKKVMAIYDGQIVLLEVKHNKIEKFSIPFSEVICIERGKILLHSWLIIKTMSGAISITFNTVNEGLFQPVIAEIRQRMGILYANDTVSYEGEIESAKFNYLNTVNHQYMNYGIDSIRPCDTVVGIAYQPERCVQEYKLFSKTLFRRYATSHISILTEQELILIKQNNQIKTEKEVLYGGVFTYIPRNRIQDISFITYPEQSLSIMEVTLSNNLHFTSEFSLDNEELQIFQQKCRDIRRTR